MSKPSSVRTSPRTPFIVAPAAALLFVGPVLASSRPSFALSLESPVVQVGSLKGTTEIVVNVGGTNAATTVDVGQPSPPSQPAVIKFVLDGSNSTGFTVNLSLWPNATPTVRQTLRTQVEF